MDALDVRSENMPHRKTIQIDYQGKQWAISAKYNKLSDHWLVFLHGLGCSKECFDYAYDTRLAKKYSILTFDFIGFGDSAKPNDFSYSLEDHAAVAKLVIDYFKPTDVVLVAHSMGGTIGVLLTQRLTNVVRLINVEGNLISEDAGIVSRRTAEQTENEFKRHGFNRFLANLKDSDEPAYRTWAGWYASSSKIAVYRSCCSLVEWSDNKELLTFFNGLPKKAYIFGDRTDVETLLPHLDHANIISIPNGAHFMMLDNPEAFYAAVEEALEAD